MHESSFDQLYAYLRKHEVHANEVRMMRERFPDPLALVANLYTTPPYNNNHQPQYNSSLTDSSQSYSALVVHQAPVVHQQSYQAPAPQQQSPAVFPQLDLGLIVPSFLPTDDLIASLNKAMTFISTTFAS
ncbi:hypothetical protein Tco_0195974 [Tanacetum coccineum]